MNFMIKDLFSTLDGYSADQNIFCYYGNLCLKPPIGPYGEPVQSSSIFTTIS